ncbi:MAG: Spy/CpxP family protein refolding chaperone [Methylibium sp.]|uniref:Spy/CpxP family protein refolding chaperone n=1 Tax=Methylibium sp. TaxID=2067992 RepID=UPI0017A2D8A7|nr:Spy/CpxP family protein refolding chaperone [Methylibium sp.]MBA3597171.1 Spy/CpxP family protein refolding chaperone [Methylibium sp.]
MRLSTVSSRGMRGVLLGVTVALAGASVAAWADPGRGQHAQYEHHGHHGGAMRGGSPRHIERMLDSVNATDAQRAQIRQIAEAAAAENKDRRAAGRSLRQQQMELFAQPTVDANAVEALRRQMLAEHDQTSQRMTQAMLDISRLLTPEQRAQMAEKQKDRRELMKKHHRERRQLDAPAG